MQRCGLRRLLIPLTAAFVLGCAGTPGASVAPSVLSGAPVASPTQAPPATPTSSGSLSLGICHGGQTCSIDGGAYVTDGGGFLPGLAIRIPAGWFASEQDAGELSLHPNDDPDDQLLLWKDLVVVVSNHRTAAAGTHVAGIGTTPEAVLNWFTSNPDFTVISARKAETVGNGIAGAAVSLETSKTANYGDPGCPANPHCADLLTDPIHWGSNFFGIGGDEAVRLFAGTITFPQGIHTIYVTLDAPSAAELERFASEAQSIIDSLGAPQMYVAN